MIGQTVSRHTNSSRLQTTSPPTDPGVHACIAPRNPSLVSTVRVLALVLSLTGTAGCVSLPNVTNVEEDAGSIFCTFYHYRYPGEDEGTLRSTDDGITWTRIYPAGDSRDAVFVCRCRAGLLAELDDRSWSRPCKYHFDWELPGDGQQLCAGTDYGTLSTDRRSALS